MSREEISGGVASSIFVASFLVLGLRLVVGWGHVQDLGVEPDADIKLALGVMGFGYLACGVVVFRRVRTAASGLFALHCLGQAVHWGGPPNQQLATWLVYFVISMLGISALLHFTLLFPSRWQLAGRRATRLFLYLPIALAAVLAVARVLTTGATGETLQGIFFILELIQVNLYALLAIVVVAVRFAGAGRVEGRANGLGVMLAGMVLAYLPYVVASLVPALAPADPQLLTLFFLLSPVVIAHAILRVGRPRGLN